MKTQTSKVCVITGANAGIGKAMVAQLAPMGYEIVMVCRNPAKAETAANEIRKTIPEANLRVMIADMSNQASIRAFADEFNATYSHCDLLINNAGVLLPTRVLSPDGYEMMFATNHLGYFLTTALLLEKLRAAPSARIVNVSSAAHLGGTINFDNLQSEKSFNNMRQYGSTKLANILFTKELARRLAGTSITTSCFHPGVVASEFGQEVAGVMGFFMRLAQPFLRTTQKAATIGVYLATSEDAATINGEYIENKKIKTPSKMARNMDIAKKLWDVSERLCNITVFPQKTSVSSNKQPAIEAMA